MRIEVFGLLPGSAQLGPDAFGKSVAHIADISNAMRRGQTEMASSMVSGK